VLPVLQVGEEFWELAIGVGAHLYSRGEIDMDCEESTKDNISKCKCVLTPLYFSLKGAISLFGKW